MGITSQNLRTKKAYDVAPFQRLAGSISRKSRNFNLAVYPRAEKKKPMSQCEVNQPGRTYTWSGGWSAF